MSSATDRPSIVHATVGDVPEILAMIKELADYEKEPEKVLATEDSLKRTLTFAPGGSTTQHSNPGYAKCLILRTPTDRSDKYKYASDAPGSVAGMALYFNNYSTWRSKPGVYLEDLFVRPQYRKRGWGKYLIQALAQEVLRIDGARLEWSCLKWNEPSLQFYRSLGAKEMHDWVQLRVDGQALVDLARGETEGQKKGQ
ncbi:hypothetical protein M409DRAFT_28396 [Zasmidium cellare ATCC 36951]|uniref:N-acetyltransferase domain-containing protein n=1 Tax=Zasmidium cellare ATCC 36951 TaxID=1080233 RepID=A0A6A6C6Q5_ZASCE|nr:uncharacterized protein M409DRAFT_28396 [Zasmidium cellare ATCC 36951]KAF2161066.1 hypothetical protein M409DRAFT_28396 [Zasmidium cellare ATCC 36951]